MIGSGGKTPREPMMDNLSVENLDSTPK